MQQIKIFKAFESSLASMEKEVNTWLAESGARVLQMFGNLAPQSGERNEANSLAAYPYVASDVLLVILYEPRSESAPSLSVPEARRASVEASRPGQE